MGGGGYHKAATHLSTVSGMPRPAPYAAGEATWSWTAECLIPRNQAPVPRTLPISVCLAPEVGSNASTRSTDVQQPPDSFRVAPLSKWACRHRISGSVLDGMRGSMPGRIARTGQGPPARQGAARRHRRGEAVPPPRWLRKGVIRGDAPAGSSPAAECDPPCGVGPGP